MSGTVPLRTRNKSASAALLLVAAGASSVVPDALTRTAGYNHSTSPNSSCIKRGGRRISSCLSKPMPRNLHTRSTFSPSSPIFMSRSSNRVAAAAPSASNITPARVTTLSNNPVNERIFFSRCATRSVCTAAAFSACTDTWSMYSMRSSLCAWKALN